VDAGAADGNPIGHGQLLSGPLAGSEPPILPTRWTCPALSSDVCGDTGHYSPHSMRILDHAAVIGRYNNRRISGE
jgi:hypothetical protein